MEPISRKYEVESDLVPATEEDFKPGATIYWERPRLNPWALGDEPSINHVCYPGKIEKSNVPGMWYFVALSRITTWPNHLPGNPKGTRLEVYRGHIRNGEFFKKRN